jgi:hypothetical protein
MEILHAQGMNAIVLAASRATQGRARLQRAGRGIPDGARGVHHGVHHSVHERAQKNCVFSAAATL